MKVAKYIKENFLQKQKSKDHKLILRDDVFMLNSKSTLWHLFLVFMQQNSLRLIEMLKVSKSCDNGRHSRIRLFESSRNHCFVMECIGGGGEIVLLYIDVPMGLSIQ